MKTEDIYAHWKQTCQKADVQTDFTARTMAIIHASIQNCHPQTRRAAHLTTLAWAAGVLLIVLGHATTVGMLLCTLTGVAQ